VSEQRRVVGETPDDGLVEFFSSGDTEYGDFRCADCGYGIVIVASTLPDCPMCRGSVWEAGAPAPPGRPLAEDALHVAGL
jgi:hypothetical protein